MLLTRMQILKRRDESLAYADRIEKKSFARRDRTIAKEIKEATYKTFWRGEIRMSSGQSVESITAFWTSFWDTDVIEYQEVKRWRWIADNLEFLAFSMYMDECAEVSFEDLGWKAP